MSWLLVFAIASILLGAALIVRAYRPSATAVPVRVDPMLELLRARHQLGLGHRLFARLVGAPRRGLEDEGFLVCADLWMLTRPYAQYPRAMAITEFALPLLEVEQLLERVDSFSSRVRRWRPRGRARGQV